MDGNPTGLIHGKFSFCKNSELPMPYDGDISGYLSAVKTLDELKEWFPDRDMERLREFGFRTLEYAASDFKRHGNHWLIDKETSVLRKILKI